MLTVWNSFLLVFLGEMGDKTQLLALILVSRYQKPWTILFGILVATLLNHALASWAGVWIGQAVPQHILPYALAVIFFAFALWILVPDKDEGLNPKKHFGVFATTVVAFFMAEMGDKTQLATIALGAKFDEPWLVTIGSTGGMLVANALAVFMGRQLLKKIPMKWMRIFASLLFALFGLAVLLGASQFSRP